jgi:hypothetical protein
MGAGFSRLLTLKGFDIAIGNDKPEKAVALAKDIGAFRDRAIREPQDVAMLRGVA